MIKARQGQSILEYTVLLVTVAAAFMAMHLYIQRAVNARIHNMQVEISPPVLIATR